MKKRNSNRKWKKGNRINKMNMGVRPMRGGTRL